MSDAVLVDVNDGVMTITINRPEARNAANKAVADGIAAAVDKLDASDDIHVAILTGANNTFCSGMDLKAFVTGELPVVEGRGFCGIGERGPVKPLIAAVEGYALAGGLELALACDLIVGADNSKYGIPEAKRGLVAGGGGLLRLPYQIAPRIAMELALVGDPITAERAYDLGLINKVVPAGTALEAAKEMAQAIAANGPLAVKVSKEVISKCRDWSNDTQFAEQDKLALPVFVSEDATEGATAFAEKRKPNWKGK